VRPAFTAFLLGDVLAALVAGALILADQVALGIALGVLVVVVASTIGVRRLRR
jgi:hypothetical protein